MSWTQWPDRNTDERQQRRLMQAAVREELWRAAFIAMMGIGAIAALLRLLAG